MPTFMAMIVASLASFVAYNLLKEYAFTLGIFASFILWVLVFFYMKKFLNSFKP